MNQNQLANSYLRTKVLTAGPEQLRMMLYEGAIKFARQALHSLNAKDFEAFYNGVSQTQKIINELDSSLNHDIAPDLCEKMASLYNYMYMRLVDANMQRDPELLEETIRLLEYERETWALLLKKIQEQGTNPTATPAAEENVSPIASIGPPANQPQTGTDPPTSGGFSVQG